MNRAPKELLQGAFRFRRSVNLIYRMRLSRCFSFFTRAARHISGSAAQTPGFRAEETARYHLPATAAGAWRLPSM
jgi:hypothetical protein